MWNDVPTKLGEQAIRSRQLAQTGHQLLEHGRPHRLVDAEDELLPPTDGGLAAGQILVGSSKLKIDSDTAWGAQIGIDFSLIKLLAIVERADDDAPVSRAG